MDRQQLLNNILEMLNQLKADNMLNLPGSNNESFSPISSPESKLSTRL